MRTWRSLTAAAAPLLPRSRRGAFVLAATFAGALLAAPTASARDIEPTAGAFLDIDVNPRGVAMGSTGWLSARDLESAYSNPAGLSHLTGQRAGLMHAEWFEGLTLEWAGYGVQVGEGAGAAVAATFLRSGSVDRYDALGNPEGTFTVYDAALGASIGRRFGEYLRAGLTAKVLHHSIDDVSATGFAADLGTSVETRLGSLAIVATNIGPSVSIDGDRFPLPTALGVGVSAPFLQDRVRVNLGGNYPLHYYEDVRLGVEVRPVSAFALRAGYRYVIDPGTDDQLTAFTYGVGVWASNIRFDYAFQPFDELGDTHRVGLTASFGGSSRARPNDAPPARPADQAPAPSAARADRAAPAAPREEPATAPAAQAPAEQTRAQSAPAEAPARVSSRWAVVAGTHGSRISALRELRSLRINGLEGGTLEKLGDGRFRIVVGEFDSEKAARAWIDGPGVSHGKLSFSVVPVE
jgi:hypothetical protein